MPALTISASNLNMPPKSAIFGGFTAHEDFLAAAGYSAGNEIRTGNKASYTGGGFEWSSVRNPHNAMAQLAFKLATAGHIGSLHQSWRSTTVLDIATRFLHPRAEWNGKPNTPQNVVRALGLAATIPFIKGSLGTLASLQKAAGVALPVVAYPNEQQPPGVPERFRFDYPTLAEKFAALRHQPTAETLQAWDVLSANPATTVMGMLAIQAAYGFNEIAWDTRHSQSDRHGLRFADPFTMVHVLAEQGAIPEIHLNLTGDTEALRQTLNGNLDRTSHGAMLRIALSGLARDYALTITTEVTAADLSAVGQKDTAEGNRQIVEAIVGMV